jgi:phospholipase C
MRSKPIAWNLIRATRLALGGLAALQLCLGPTLAAAQTTISPDDNTNSPIKHVIVIIGENRSFDHVFATYVPQFNQVVWNLLSEEIINADGTPGPNFALANQSAATDAASDGFLLAPPKTPFPNNVLPAPLTGGPSSASYIPNNSLEVAEASENGLLLASYSSLITGGYSLAGLTGKTPDTRITNVNALPTGPFQLTNATTFPYFSYAASPVHRFYQMWQQLDCDISHATPGRPSGCLADLFPWVEVTIGAGDNGKAQAATFSTEYSATATTTGEGSTSMGFYNMQQGDAPYFKLLAENFAISDNFHQSVLGGTGANHIMLGHGDAIFFSDGNGNATTPPENVMVDPGTALAGVVSEIENPNAQANTNNYWVEDGYGSFSSTGPFGGGSYSNCSDSTQPGVGPVVAYLQSLPRPISPRCEPGHYYLLNNYNPGYFGNGNNAFIDTNTNNTPFTIPPSAVPSIGDVMLAAGVSWKYYGDQWDNYVPDPYQLNYGAIGAQADEYCNICNPFQYDTSIMANADVRTAQIQDSLNLYSDIESGTLPAVSFVKPSGLVDGHPASSKLDLFEGFVAKIVSAVQANTPLWQETAIFITFDEGGGYYDSGYVQPLDFFGDGTRIPLLVVSPWAAGGYVSHNYTDHVSILKFIERNWNLPTITTRSRDNFPNPVADISNPWVPINSPAIGDLFDLFTFNQQFIID